MPTGTYTIADLLENRFDNVSPIEFGMDTIREVIENDIEAHNRIVDELLMEFAEPSDDLQRIYGTAVDGKMVEVDEFGRGPTQKDRPGDTCGFPLRRYQFAIGWTRAQLQLMSVRDMAIALDTAEKAHLNALRRDIKRALYLSSNYTFRDYMATRTNLAVKRLVNADGAPIPPGPNGETFDGATHTHYNAVAALDNASAEALVVDVVEHGHSEDVRIAINKADESAWRGLSDFKAYVDVRLTRNANANEPIQHVDTIPVDNRPIGLFNGAEVWIKPWAIANYALCWDAGDMAKPLVKRQRPQSMLVGLRIAGENPSHPLLAQYMEDDFGFGAWTRTNGAVLFFNGGAYADPTIN